MFWPQRNLGTAQANTDTATNPVVRKRLWNPGPVNASGRRTSTMVASNCDGAAGQAPPPGLINAPSRITGTIN